IIFIIYFFLAGKKRNIESAKKVKPAESAKISPNSALIPSLKTDVTNIYGLSGLLLDKPRSGEDLTYLKSLKNEAGKLLLQLRPNAPNTDTELDNDKIIRRLKGIRVLIVSADATGSLMMKDYLRKKIRLCTINTINTSTGIDTTQADVI